MIELLLPRFTEPQYVDSQGLFYGEQLRGDIVQWLHQQGIRYTMGFHDTEYAGRYLTIVFYDKRDHMLFKLRWH